MSYPELEGFASLIRNIGDECTLLRICDGKLVAGSRNGSVVCWDISDGREIWRLSLDGPCSSSESDGVSIFFAESDKIHAANLMTGEILWSINLEGSSDLIFLTGRALWATSSFYNFELQDYVDGAVWRIDSDGDISGRWDIEGRAWSLSANEEEATIGLSRPRCGYAEVSQDKGVLYQSLGNSSPVTVGGFSNDGLTYMGHSDGVVSKIVKSGPLQYELASSAINSIEINKGLVVGTETGEIICHDNHKSWEVMSRGNVDWVKSGPSPVKGDSLWACAWSDKSIVTLIEMSSGSIELQLSHQYRIGISFSSKDLVALGDDVGGIYIFERSVLSRRLSRANEIGSMSKDDVLLRRKLRNLRR